MAAVVSLCARALTDERKGRGCAGDVKTNTSRYPTEEIRAVCGPNSGDWATFTTDLHLADDSHSTRPRGRVRDGGVIGGGDACTYVVESSKTICRVSEENLGGQQQETTPPRSVPPPPASRPPPCSHPAGRL